VQWLADNQPGREAFFGSNQGERKQEIERLMGFTRQVIEQTRTIDGEATEVVEEQAMAKFKREPPGALSSRASGRLKAQRGTRSLCRSICPLSPLEAEMHITILTLAGSVALAGVSPMGTTLSAGGSRIRTVGPP
jgi:hypothetical protein